jgi:hypothetical protein
MIQASHENSTGAGEPTRAQTHPRQRAHAGEQGRKPGWAGGGGLGPWHLTAALALLIFALAAAFGVRN